MTTVVSPHPAVRAAGGPDGCLVLGAHGGCGTSTVAAHLAGAREVALPEATIAAHELALVVAAATADGTSLAVRCLHRLELAGYSCEQLHLVLVRDGRGPIPTSARARLRLLSSVVAGVTVLPHVQRWRYERSEQRSPSRRYERALQGLRRAVATPTPAAIGAVL